MSFVVSSVAMLAQRVSLRRHSRQRRGATMWRHFDSTRRCGCARLFVCMYVGKIGKRNYSAYTYLYNFNFSLGYGL